MERGLRLKRRLRWEYNDKGSERIYTLWGTEYSGVKALENVASKLLYVDQNGC